METKAKFRRGIRWKPPNDDEWLNRRFTGNRDLRSYLLPSKGHWNKSWKKIILLKKEILDPTD